MSQLSDIKTKIRALIGDFLKSATEAFTYTTSSTFELEGDNISTIITVKKNGTLLEEDDYSFDSDSKEITISEPLSSNDIVTVKYNYYQYSDTELTEYIRASLIWISIYGSCEDDFELESDEITPTPENDEIDLTSLIASIIINPNYTMKRLPDISIRYPKKLSKEEKIKRIISDFYAGNGIVDLIRWD